MLHLIAGLLLNFNPLPRKEGDEVYATAAIGTADNFNPLPRKEGDAGLWWQPHLHKCISIHSLVKRETLIFNFQIALILFQSTPS